MQKFFRWDGPDAPIKAVWEIQCSGRYRDNLSTYQTSNKQHQSISDDVWRAWQERWSQQSYVQKHAQASKNRLSQKAGPGIGPSKHTRGSRSMRDHERAMVRTKYCSAHV